MQGPVTPSWTLPRAMHSVLSDCYQNVPSKSDHVAEPVRPVVALKSSPVLVPLLFSCWLSPKWWQTAHWLEERTPIVKKPTRRQEGLLSSNWCLLTPIHRVIKLIFWALDQVLGIGQYHRLHCVPPTPEFLCWSPNSQVPHNVTAFRVKITLKR